LYFSMLGFVLILVGGVMMGTYSEKDASNKYQKEFMNGLYVLCSGIGIIIVFFVRDVFVRLY
jgi:glucose uptake protein GlcU